MQPFYYVYNITKMKKTQYILDNILFDSSWELAIYMYLRDFGHSFEYHPDFEIPYKIDEDAEKFYIFHPDFKINDKIVEVKSNYLFDHFSEKEQAKIELLETLGVDIWTKDEVKPFIDYVDQNYGKRYLASRTKELVMQSENIDFNKIIKTFKM